MALSINKLKNDQILIKNVDAIQTAAMVHDICVGKSGTITTANMHVAKYQLFDNYEPNDNEWDIIEKQEEFSKGIEMMSELRNIITESIINNSDVRCEIDDTNMVFKPNGDSLEVGMMNFMLENDFDIQDLII